MTTVDLFAEAAPPPVVSKEEAQAKLEQFFDKKIEEAKEEAKTYSYIAGNKVDNETGDVVDQMAVLKFLDWPTMPEPKDFTRAHANTVGFKIAQARRDAQAYKDNGEALAKPLEERIEWLTNSFAEHFHHFLKVNVPRKGKRAANPGQASQGYVQLEACKIKGGTTGGYNCTDGDQYKEFLKGQTQEWLAARGATIELKINIKDISQEVLTWLINNFPKLEISLGGKEAVTKLLKKGEAIAGWKVETEDPVGTFRGVE